MGEQEMNAVTLSSLSPIVDVIQWPSTIGNGAHCIEDGTGDLLHWQGRPLQGQQYSEDINRALIPSLRVGLARQMKIKGASLSLLHQAPGPYRNGEVD